MLLLVDGAGEADFVAPLFRDGGTIYWVGSGGSDYLDFIGTPDSAVVRAVLEAAREASPDFSGFCFYHLRNDSPTTAALHRAAAALDLRCHEEYSMTAPFTRLEPGRRPPPADKASLVRHERALRRDGVLDVTHFREPSAIEAELEAFFDQHVRRWAARGERSLFHDERQRRFYRALARSAGEADWLRFTRVAWRGRPVAYHFGFCHEGSFLWYKPSFETELAKRSPGEVLLRQLLLAAAEEGAAEFDFGLGDEPFKQRFATGSRTVTSWRLLPG